MPNFLYVVAYVPEGSKKDTPFSFKHLLIKGSPDLEDAYKVGLRVEKDMVQGEILNKYCFELTPDMLKKD